MKISNRKIHFFNPGHEDAIRTGKSHYTPPAAVCKMMNDLSFLPAWYGQEGDFVIINETDETFRFLLSIPSAIRPAVSLCTTTPPLPAPVEAAPWGLSPHSIRFFEKISLSDGHLIIPPWKEQYARLTGRQTALACLSKIRSLLPEYFESLTLPCFCSTPDEIRRFMATYPPPYLLKTPYSCSGRGLYRMQTNDFDLQTSRWLEGAFKKQGVVSIEPALDKVCDFAMEFYANGCGQIRFEGLSVFETSSKDTYTGNLLGSQSFLEQQMSAFVPMTQLWEIQEAVATIWTEVAGSDYRGYLGVDMLVYRINNAFAVHPIIEINLRYTMGLVALQLSRRLVHPSATGKLLITFDKMLHSAYRTHLQMKAQYPLLIVDNKISSGYLSLCPVTTETHYRAYVLIETVRSKNENFADVK